MPRKYQSEEQKAQTEYTDMIEDDPALVKAVEESLRHLAEWHNLSRCQAKVALRDYTQLLVARELDASFAETQAQVRALEKQRL